MHSMTSYEIFDLFLHSFAIIVSGGAIIITYMAIMSARGDNFLASILNIINSFFQRVDQMSHEFSPAGGPKVFELYSRDLSDLLIRSKQKLDPNYRNTIRYTEDPDISHAQSKAQYVLDAAAYINRNRSDLSHYIHFYTDFLKSVDYKLESGQRELVHNILKSKVSDSEWEFLYLYAYSVNNIWLTKFIQECNQKQYWIIKMKYNFYIN